jgi:hypothetical protein
MYFSVDIESNGPIPGEYSMTALGCCVVGQPDRSFYVELKPISDKVVPHAEQVGGLTLDYLRINGADPAEAMARFDSWVRETAGEDRQPVFVAFNATYDWLFVHWYLTKFVGHSPFSHSGLDGARAGGDVREDAGSQRDQQGGEVMRPTPLLQPERARLLARTAVAATLMILALMVTGCGGGAPEEAAAEPTLFVIPSEQPAEEEEEPASEDEPPFEVAFEGETAVEGEDAVFSGELAVESLGVGTVDASAPAEMTVGDSGTVRVEIRPLYDPEDVQVERYVTVTAVEDPVEELTIYGELRLYSFMSAAISAPGFDVESATPETQHLTADTPALWVWNVIAREAGRRTITVSISVPMIVDGERLDVATSPLRTIEFVMIVSGPPTPTPTVTPIPTETPTPTATVVPTLTPIPTPTPSFAQRTFDEIGPEVVAAIILGALGTIGTFIWGRLRRSKDRADRRSKKK